MAFTSPVRPPAVRPPSPQKKPTHTPRALSMTKLNPTLETLTDISPTTAVDPSRLSGQPVILEPLETRFDLSDIYGAGQSGAYLNGSMFASPLEDPDMLSRRMKGAPKPPGFRDSADDDSSVGSHMLASPGSSPSTTAVNGKQMSSLNLDENSAATYPGLVMGSATGLGFDTVKFDEEMADFMDPTAAGTSSGHGGANAPAGANIAPWLQEDEPPSPATSRYTSESTPPAETYNPPSRTPSTYDESSIGRKKGQHPSHFPSMPTLPRLLHRHHTSQSSPGDEDSFPPYGSAAASLRSSSASSLIPDAGAMTPTSGKARSVRGVEARRETSPAPQVPDRQGSVPDRQGSAGAHRFTRFGSTASAMSSSPSLVPDKKKGFLGNLLRRGTRQQSLAVTPSSHPDLSPVPPRSSTGPGRLSITPSVGSSKLRHQSVSSNSSSTSSTWQSPLAHHRDLSYRPDEVSPLEEVGEHEFHLNTDLDDMEGIVDSRVANAPRPSMNSIGPAPSSSIMDLADALHHTSSFAEEGSPKAGETALEFQRPNPFAPRSSAGSDAPAITSISPKTSTAPGVGPVLSMTALTNAPRRPSQLRNVKINSVDSQSSDSSGVDRGPIAPSWAQGDSSTGPRFMDPFSQRPTPAPAQGSPVSPSRAGVGSFDIGGMGSIGGIGGMAPAIPPYIPASGGEAWAAPESWGVEPDELPEEEETSSSSGSDEEWTERNRSATPVASDKRRDSLTSVGSGSKHSHHGHGHHHHKHRQKTTHNGVPKLTSGDSAASVPYFIRIYRADDSYTVMSFPLGTTAAELITDMLGSDGKKDGKKTTTNMKLYVRERGQDRQLLPSERPLALQMRRLMQAGYTEQEHIPELGKEDISMLCRFIYQTPVLPIINPEEESGYESFEFIDLSARDLQTIPIFLHLHADNIIILNVSRNPMTDIPLDFIQACTSLKELRMSNMALKRVPGSIRASTTLSRLDLSCNRISDLESAHLDDISTLLSLKVQNNRLSSIPTYFLQMKALKYLNISNNTFETFPSVVCEMSNLVDLDVSFNQIAALPPQMSDLKSLERLICVGNELKEFPESFSTLANLRVLDVRRNKLVDLTPIYALPNLAVLRADSNDLITLDTQLGPKVRDFSVPYNSITRFTLAPMPGQTAAYSLTHLNLAHAKLSTLEESALADLVNLVDLNLSFNQFTRLPQTIDRLANLETFSCTDNMLAALPPNCFGKAQRLRICNLHNNNLKDLPSDLWLCSSIEVINLSSNLLEALPTPPSTWESNVMLSPQQEPPRKFSTVSGVSVVTTSSDKSRRIPPAGVSLKSLFLADNRLTEEVFHQIALFSSLRVLNVSFNDIVEVPPYTLRRCDKLEALYLSGNKLTSLPSEDLETLQNLKILHLNGNRLQTLPSELGAIKNLEHLDVGSNVLKYNIANWPYDWNWNWNTALRYLNLSGNKRLEIKPTSGQDLTHTTQGLFRRELSDFTGLTHLRVLGLMDVTLRIPSLPDESDEKRVRTSFSSINNMAYGISDMLGSIEHLAMFDLAVPNFRGSNNDCVFGMFGRATPTVPAGKIPKFIQEHFASVLAEQLLALQPGEQTTEALRRTFLDINKMAYDSLHNIEKRRHDSEAGYMLTRSSGSNLPSQLRTGASGAIVYLKEKTLHVANAGDALVVLSRKGEAELLSKRHDPTDREETARIRRAEAWVSPKGLVNDDKDIDISRAFGFYQALPAVNASPEVRTRLLTESDEFVIIGNSALWKCCSYQTAVDIARTERDDPMIAAQKLRDFAISYGAEGSVMVMVVNVSDIFRGRFGGGSGNGLDLAVDSEYLKRAQRRKAEVEVGDRTLNRLQQEIEPPTGQVALVFTDIVNSTALWETNPGMPTAIKMHHNLMRRQLRLDEGYEVKTEGDAFMVSFQSVTAAIAWAFNCQIQLLHQEWPRELLESEDGRVIYDSKGNIIHRGLRVRMGVHWGEPSCERDPITRRMDYYGPMVNRSARVSASADGGQLMASQDVINEIRVLREYIESSDENSLDELGPDEKREVQELRRIGGIEFKDMGERKLKGLEVPEKLSLLYPKTLAGRLELFSGLRADVEVNEAKSFASAQSIEEARQLATIVLRLEALCAFDPTATDRPLAAGLTSPPLHAAPERLSLQAARKSISGPSALGLIPGAPVPGAPQAGHPPGHPPKPAGPNPHLGPTIRDNMTEDEVLEIVSSLTTRIENCLSTLYLKHLGGFSTVLAALENATRIDSNLLIHALSLMSGSLAAGAVNA